MPVMARGWTVFSVIAICLEPAAALADPIRITSGRLVGNQSVATVTLVSAGRGFSLVGNGDSVGGIWAPGLCDGDCLPGSVQSLAAIWSGSDFPGKAAIDGRTFNVDVGTEITGSANVAFNGSWIAPPFTNRTTAKVVSSFTFEGNLFFPPTLGQHSALDLLGSGVATLRLSRSADAPGWKFVSADYRFKHSDHSPVPEPTSILLLGTGLGGVFARRMRRRSG
jgi:PEP-CTERM motif